MSCKAQEKMTLKYIGQQYKGTKNENFVNQEIIFLKANDTFRVNIKMPFDVKSKKIINRGIYYNCHLKSGTVYTITLKRICVNSIPDVPNSYYKTNTIPDKKDCSKFTEVEKNTAYRYEGNYGKYVDIDGALYEIVGLSPGDGCVFHN
jgi:hypothetical protein